MDEPDNIAPPGVTRRAATAGLLSIAVPGPGPAAVQTASAPLVFSAAAMAVEPAPIRLAVRRLYGARVVERNGGVVDLVGPNRKADVAANGETQNLRHSVAEPTMRIVMTVTEGHYPILARRAAGIAALADLKGKRILSYRRTTAGYFLHKMLKSVGLTAADVTIVETPLGKVGTAVAAHEVDATAIWEPDSEQALKALRAIGDDVVIFSGKAIYYERYNLCTTADALADPAKRRAIVALMRAIITATDDISRDPAIAAQAQALIAKSGGLYTVEEIARCWPNVKFVASFDDHLLDVLAEQEIWLAAEEKRRPRSRAELAPLIDRSAYDEARAFRAG